MIAENDLSYVDKGFQRAEEPEVGASVPDGTYLAKVDAVDVANSQAGNLGLSQTLVVIEGECAGRNVFRWNGIPKSTDTPEKALQQLGFLKRDLKTYGIDIEARNFKLSHFLANQRNELLDRVVEIQVKTKQGQDRPNVYVNKFVRMMDGAEAVPVAVGSDNKPGPGEEGFDPFSEE